MTVNLTTLEAKKLERRIEALEGRQMTQPDYHRFNALMHILQNWRDQDHEDNLVLCRSDVIQIIEGVRELRREAGK